MEKYTSEKVNPRTRTTVYLKFQFDRFYSEITIHIQGELKGSNLINYAIDEILEKQLSKKTSDDVSLFFMNMNDPFLPGEDGYLTLEDDENRQEEWLKDMLVEFKIVSCIQIY